MVRKMDIDIHKKMKKVLDRKVEILKETNRIDPNDRISLSRMKNLYTQLDKEYIQMRWELSRRYEI